MQKQYFRGILADFPPRNDLIRYDNLNDNLFLKKGVQAS